MPTRADITNGTYNNFKLPMGGSYFVWGTGVYAGPSYSIGIGIFDGGYTVNANDLVGSDVQNTVVFPRIAYWKIR